MATRPCAGRRATRALSCCELAIGAARDLPSRGMDLDPDVPREILEPYPPLWEYWQREMSAPGRDKKYGSGGMKEMHDPVFLREVVRQHRWLTEGPGDQPDPALKQQLDEILEPCPEVREERERQL